MSRLTESADPTWTLPRVESLCPNCTRPKSEIREPSFTICRIDIVEPIDRKSKKLTMPPDCANTRRESELPRFALFRIENAAPNLPMANTDGVAEPILTYARMDRFDPITELSRTLYA